jgi:hypothetical protein
MSSSANRVTWRTYWSLAALVLAFVLVGCSKRGYQREYGKWAFVWYGGDGREVRYLEDAEGKLTILSNKVYATTVDHVYLIGVKLPDADPATFEMLTYPYSKDAKQAYCGSIPIAGANPATFQVLGGFLDPYVRRPDRQEVRVGRRPNYDCTDGYHSCRGSRLVHGW